MFFCYRLYVFLLFTVRSISNLLHDVYVVCPDAFLLISGPSHWGAVCQAGKSQSPIDIQTPNLPDTNYEAFTFHGYNKELKDDKITNNGHTVQMGFSLHHKQIPPTVSKSKL